MVGSHVKTFIRVSVILSLAFLGKDVLAAKKANTQEPKAAKAPEAKAAEPAKTEEPSKAKAPKTKKPLVPEPRGKESLEELVKLSPPEALVRSIKHILKTKPREYKNGQEYLKQAESIVAKMQVLLPGLDKGDAEAMKLYQDFEALKFQALVTDNPYITFDETLVVMSDRLRTKNNWLGTHVMGAKGQKNKIAKFNIRTKQITDVYEPKDGSFVGEPDIYFDGSKLLFTSSDAKSAFQVMEVGIDGSNLRQVSKMTGEYVHSYGGIYLPNDKIIFSSTAPLVGVPCIGGSQTVPNLYLMGPNGENPRQLTFEQDADWFPTVLADGKIMYLRWEYTDIMHYYTRIMMSMNPDGSNQRSIYGSQSLWPNAMLNARPIPGQSGQFVAIVSGHHGVAGTGKITIFDTNKGYAHADGVVQHIPGYGKKVTHVTVDQLYPKVKKELLVQFPNLQKDVDALIARFMKDSPTGKDYHEMNNEFFNKCYPRLREYYPEMALDLDSLANGIYPQCIQPYPINANYFLVVAQLTPGSPYRLYLVDTFDNFVSVQPEDMGQYKVMTEPYVLQKRERPPVIPERVNLQDKEAVCYIQNIYRGPGLKNVPVGEVDSLRVFTYVYGYYRTGNHHHLGVESGWDCKRVLGHVKVEKDGSAMFKIPANTTISIQPLDKQGRAIQLFRSWLVAMPGEELSCVGCHEPPNEPPVTSKTMASLKEPQRLTPYRTPVEGFSFVNEVQPVLDAYCVRCHDGTDPKKPDFKKTSLASNTPSDNFSNSYHAFHRYFRRPGPESNGIMGMPYEFHSSTSEGIQLLEKGHYGVKLDADSWRRLYMWIDLNVPYYGSWSSVYASTGDRGSWASTIAAKAEDSRQKYAGASEDENREYVSPTPHPVTATQEKSEERQSPVSVSADSWPFSEAVAQEMQKKLGTEKKTIEVAEGVSITFVRIPAGEFIMGSDTETAIEQPRQKIKIEKPFWMSEGEVNNAAFFAFKPDHNASVYDQQWKDHVRLGYYANYVEQPATRMNWQDAQAFCAWLSKKSNMKVALPTEAQWEWACRAGSDKDMFFGDKTADFSPYANLADKSIEKFAVTGVNPTFNPKNVGNRTLDFIPRISAFNDSQFLVTGTKQYKPNAWGLYDMHGNVAEWTRSDYVRYPYSAAKSNTLSSQEKKAVRGGSFFDRPYRATASYRLGYAPWQGVFNVGFRVIIEE